MQLHKCLKPSLSKSLPKEGIDGSNAYSTSFVLGGTIALFSIASALADLPYQQHTELLPTTACYVLVSVCLLI